MSESEEISGAAHALEQRIEALAHDIATTINDGQSEAREALRDVAVSILRDEVQPDAPAPAPPSGGIGGQSFNPFGIGIPLCLMGVVLIFLFPPVGLLLFGAAALMIAWGVGATLFARS